MDVSLIDSLNIFLGQPSIRELMKAAQSYVLTEINTDVAIEVATFPFALESIEDLLPKEIGSCRVSAMRKGTQCRRERHPNADQYVVSLQGRGEIWVLETDSWRKDIVTSHSLEARLHYVPAGTWHQPTASQGGDWVVAAFHTAIDVEDNYMDDDDSFI